MVSKTAGEAAGIVGTEAANQNELQEEMANVTQTESRDDDDDGFGNA